MSVSQFIDDGETDNWLLEWNTSADLKAVKASIVAVLDKKIAELEKEKADLSRFAVLERSSGSIFTKRFTGTEDECLAFQLPPDVFGGFIVAANGNIRYAWTSGNYALTNEKRCWMPEYGFSVIEGRLISNIQLWMA